VADKVKVGWRGTKKDSSAWNILERQRGREGGKKIGRKKEKGENQGGKRKKKGRGKKGKIIVKVEVTGWWAVQGNSTTNAAGVT